MQQHVGISGGVTSVVQICLWAATASVTDVLDCLLLHDDEHELSDELVPQFIALPVHTYWFFDRICSSDVLNGCSILSTARDYLHIENNNQSEQWAVSKATHRQNIVLCVRTAAHSNSVTESYFVAVNLCKQKTVQTDWLNVQQWLKCIYRRYLSLWTRSEIAFCVSLVVFMQVWFIPFVDERGVCR